MYFRAEYATMRSHASSAKGAAPLPAECCRGNELFLFSSQRSESESDVKKMSLSLSLSLSLKNFLTRVIYVT
jgi:hypothetical protein